MIRTASSKSWHHALDAFLQISLSEIPTRKMYCKSRVKGFFLKKKSPTARSPCFVSLLVCSSLHRFPCSQVGEIGQQDVYKPFEPLMACFCNCYIRRVIDTIGRNLRCLPDKTRHGYKWRLRRGTRHTLRLVDWVPNHGRCRPSGT